MTNKLTFIKTGLLLASALVLSTATSFGDTEVFDAPDATFTLPGNNASGSVDITGFDTNLGTLTEVELTLTNVDASGDVEITNTAGYNQPAVGGSINSFITVTDSANQSVEVTPSGSLTTQAVGTGQTVDFTFDSGPTGNNTVDYTTPTTVAPYENAGGNPIDLTVTGLYGESITDEGNISTVLTPSATGDLDVTYVYTPVPEPAQTSAYLMGFGLLLLVGRMYLKKRGSLLA